MRHASPTPYPAGHPRRRQLLAAAAGGLLLAACSKTGGSGGGSGSSGKKPLVIGVSLSLTGDFADSGKAEQRGYQLWADQVNGKGGLLGRQVQLKIVDDASSPTQVVTNYQNLINKDRVDLVFGPFSSLLTIPASQVAARYHYAFIESAGGGPKVFDQHLSNLFFVQPGPAVQQGGIFADYILSLPAGQRPKTAAYPSLDDPFSSPVADFVRGKLEAAGITTVYKEIYPAETTDLTPTMSKVAAARPELIVSGTQADDAYAQVRALIQLRYAPKWFYLSNGANSPAQFPDKVGPANVNGIFSSGDWFPGSKASGSDQFTTAYLNKYGGSAFDIDNTSVEAYSAGVVLEQVASKTGKVDNATIIKTLHSGTWATPVGNLSWDANGSPKGNYILVQWQGGKLVSVYPQGLAQQPPATAPLAWAK